MIEFERRFLIAAEHLDAVQQLSILTKSIAQGYICSDKNAVVRIRKTHTVLNPPKWFITVKKDTGEKGKHYEFEYEIDNGESLFNSVDKKISKRRYFVPLGHLTIEVDVFEDKHTGLIIAEVELNSEEDSVFLSMNLPKWFGKEITGEKSWSNYELCMKA